MLKQEYVTIKAMFSVFKLNNRTIKKQVIIIGIIIDIIQVLIYLRALRLQIFTP